MKRYIIILLFSLTLMLSTNTTAAENPVKPVTPDPSPEAVSLLEYIYSISGNHILTGQHNVPLNGSLRLPAMQKVTKKYPVVFGQDFGFSEPGTWDGINYRQQIVDEAIRRSNEGFVITIMWHAVRPIEEEPVEFSESIQGELNDAEWQELLTPGTPINERWKSQVDVIAFFLKQLRNAGVPVLWRPYHEMNGGWFWWGGREGESGYNKLYRMLFDRLVNFHKLNNLIWVFNANEVKLGVGDYEDFYPGNDVVDILATDVYTENFNEENYNMLLALAGDKPIALGEVGKYPTPDIIEDQPRWVWFMSWGEPFSGINSNDEVIELYESDEAITLDELPWAKVSAPRIHYPVLK